MLTTPDLYLGSFLLLCGFVLSLLNLRRIVKEQNPSFPYVLLSENLLLSCIGIAFIIRAVYKVNPLNAEMDNIELRSSDLMLNGEIQCNFGSLLMGYGPLIVSLVNSFLSLIIDNYMHYKMIADVKRDEDINTVQDMSENFRINTRTNFKKFIMFWKKNFMYITVGLQWILPVIFMLLMYPIDVTEKIVSMNEKRNLHDTCMALIDVNKQNCTIFNIVNETFHFRNDVASLNYLEMDNLGHNKSSVKKIDEVVNNIYGIVANLQNTSHYSGIYVTSAPLLRIGRNYINQCMKICYSENKNMLIYMFAIAVVSYFVPITISTIILTKIHVMDVRKQNVKTYVNREMLYNILFWTPVMFDTFLSLTMCSYNMNGMRTSIFNVIANIYQAIKNFMNTKYFKDNTVVPA